MTATLAGANGPALFVRYAFAPNRLGYCGPADAGALLEYGALGRADNGFRALAQQFEGAWPQLRLLGFEQRHRWVEQPQG